MTDLLIAPILEHYGFHLDRTDGGWQTVRCVFHGDTQASGRVSFRDAAYKCMACPAVGNAITLIAWKENVDNSTAWLKYCEIVGQDATMPEREEVPRGERAFERNRRKLASRRRSPFSG